MVGHPAPPVPVDSRPSLPIAALRTDVQRRASLVVRLRGHIALLLLAALVAAGRGFPLHDPAGGSDVLPLVAEAEADDGHDHDSGDFQRVVIPIAATQPRAMGAGERIVVIDEGPALLTPDPSRGPAFIATHVVAANETIASIAEKYAITPDSLIAANNLTNVLGIGEELRIPRVSGVPHTVEDGETLGDIGARYGVAPESIMTYPPNGLDRGQALVAGREIFVPGAALAGVGDVSVRGAADLLNAQSQAAAIVRDDRTNLRKGPGTNYDKLVKVDSGVRLLVLARHEDWVKVEADDGSSAWVARDLVSIPDEVWAGVEETDDFPPPPPPPPVWVWPTYGDLTSGFGYRNMRVGAFHNGIDIANRQGTPIVAARSGTVIEAGWCRGYGYCVKMSHGGGMTTEYGHMMSNPVVYEGQEVEAGELIGYMGTTYDRAGGGYSTGVHLHFTVKIDGTAVNPLKYLD
jgi:murein DD-endopeptidase MepM/ murein hydrolase activator NlpD